MSEMLVSLPTYYEMLERHDWHYEFSDDGGVWRRGEAVKAQLQAIANKSPEHKKLYDGFANHMFNGETWGTVQPPLPERPK